MSGAATNVTTQTPRAAPEGRLPDFIIIGAMKAGTTTLHEYLRRHPRVFMSEPKEPQFFSRDHKYARGEMWYRSLFAGAAEGQVCGEASACYSRWPHYGDVPGRIARHLPDVKLIYLMRHPVERAYSHYKHRMRKRRGRVISFEQTLDEQPDILAASLYADQIKRFHQHYPREQMLLLTLEDLVDDPDATLERIQRFLRIELVDLSAGAELRSNAADQNLVRKRTNRLQRTLRRMPGWSVLAALAPAPAREAFMSGVRRVGGMRVWHRGAISRHQQKLTPLTPDVRRRVLRRLEGPTRELETMMGRDLSAWRR